MVIFSLEIRALAIAFYYAVGTGIGGAGGPWLLGALIGTGSRASVAAGYLLGAVLMNEETCWRLPLRSFRAASRARERSRIASCRSSGTQTALSSPERDSLARPTASCSATIMMAAYRQLNWPNRAVVE
jgi:MFS family permease